MSTSQSVAVTSMYRDHSNLSLGTYRDADISPSVSYARHTYLSFVVPSQKYVPLLPALPARTAPRSNICIYCPCQALLDMWCLLASTFPVANFASHPSCSMPHPLGTGILRKSMKWLPVTLSILSALGSEVALAAWNSFSDRYWVPKL